MDIFVDNLFALSLEGYGGQIATVASRDSSRSALSIELKSLKKTSRRETIRPVKRGKGAPNITREFPG